MKITFLPKTKTGTWSVNLFLAFIVLSISGTIISPAIGNTIEYPNPINSPLLGTVIYLMFAAAIGASVMGIISVSKYKERSILTYISIPLGMVFLFGVILLIIGNIMGPPN